MSSAPTPPLAMSPRPVNVSSSIDAQEAAPAVTRILQVNPSACNASIRCDNIPAEKLEILRLPDGTEIPYDKTVLVCDPPGKHFSRARIPELFEHWESSNLVTLNGRGIPVKYWNILYGARKLGKPGQWEVLKREWNNWKVRTCSLTFTLNPSYLTNRFWAPAVYCRGEGTSWLRSRLLGEVR